MTSQNELNGCFQHCPTETLLAAAYLAGLLSPISNMPMMLSGPPLIL